MSVNDARPVVATHDLKTWLEPFAAMWSGAKVHEVRRNDRGYRVGDRLTLREFEPGAGKYTGRWLLVEVTYLTSGGAWGLPADLCVMSISVRGASDDEGHQ
jgi:hypothetical protein